MNEDIFLGIVIGAVTYQGGLCLLGKKRLPDCLFDSMIVVITIVIIVKVFSLL